LLANLGKDWSRIVEPRDADLDALAGVLKDVRVRNPIFFR